jgi:hypothetical protein
MPWFGEAHLEARERGAQQPRDVHLGEPQVAGDRTAAAIAVERERDDPPLANRQPPERKGQREPVVGGGDRVLPAGQVVLEGREDRRSAGARGPPARRPVAEVMTDRAVDRRHGIGLERRTARRVPAVDRGDQAEAARLDEVVVGLGAPRVASGERADERHVALDLAVAGGLALGGRGHRGEPLTEIATKSTLNGSILDCWGS